MFDDVECRMHDISLSSIHRRHFWNDLMAFWTKEWRGWKLHLCLPIRIAYCIPIYIQAFDSVRWTLFRGHGMAFESPIIIDLCTYFFGSQQHYYFYSNYVSNAIVVCFKRESPMMSQCIHTNSYTSNDRTRKIFFWALVWVCCDHETFQRPNIIICFKILNDEPHLDIWRMLDRQSAILFIYKHCGNDTTHWVMKHSFPTEINKKCKRLKCWWADNQSSLGHWPCDFSPIYDQFEIPSRFFDWECLWFKRKTWPVERVRYVCVTYLKSSPHCDTV